MTTVSIPGIDQGYRVPGAYAYVLFNQGPASGFAGLRQTVFLGQILSTGTATANVRVEASNAGAAETYCGSGSKAHRFARMFHATKGGKLFLVPYGGMTGGTAASWTYTVAGTVGTGGTAHIKVCTDDCPYAFTSTDTTVTIATALRQKINNKTWLPVTATGTSAGSSDVIITAKEQGDSGNRAYRVKSWCDNNSTLTILSGGSSYGDLSGGVDGASEATSLETALAAIANTKLYYHCIGATDATSLGKLKTAVGNKSLPTPGLRCVGIAGNRSAAATATYGSTAIANGLNNELIQIVHQEDSNHDPVELAAQLAGIRAKWENVDSAYNFSGYGQQGEADWFLQPADLDSKWPTASAQNTDINEGVTCVASTSTGTYVVKSVNTRAKTGSNYDFRSTPTHIVSVCHDFADTICTKFALSYAKAKFANDQFLANGQVNPNQQRIKGVITPSQIKGGIVVPTLKDFRDAGKLQDVDASIESIDIHKSTVTQGRAEGMIDLHVIDHLDQGVFQFNEVTPG